MNDSFVIIEECMGETRELASTNSKESGLMIVQALEETNKSKFTYYYMVTLRHWMIHSLVKPALDEAGKSKGRPLRADKIEQLW